ncbi:flagellar export chaperone FlgN [Caproiciproducens sp. CPB-2]|uniref:flagellar export chaperone FlgN n=1 Tax=unclassified Caproiciproducens TaxID=2643836 RepID=UPI0023DCB00B|nr:flagellar export chaperone FlgN [Caproiciproducens sp. CPB-2]MDF1494232.1 flagellar export chaperone FlgN [Caproiciproducens sp. CPB-2]
MIEKELTEKLLKFLRDYLNFYKSFLEIESEKYNDLANNNVTTLDGHVRKEEAFMLKARGLELERDKLVAQTGSPKATFRQLIPMFEPSLQPQAKSIFDELSQVTLDLKEINLRCNQLTELKLHRIEKDVSKLKNNPELQRIYSSKAEEGSTPPSILSKKV